MMRPNFGLLIPLGAIVLAVTVLLVIAAHARGKRQAQRAWLTGGSP